MRTLKKALSLVLVLAMVLSLGVSAFAVEKGSEYTDYGTVTNKAAVDVLTALDIIHGNTDGSFGPTGNFTRAQAATMITYMMLGATTADALPTGATQFNDVPATHWAAKYIQYCANDKIINGYGDGKFGPDDKLTNTQWALMLLGALGYKAANEGIGGAGWEIQATKLAMTAKVASADDLAATFNRDMAAKMALNTLEAAIVTYESNGSSITVTGDNSTTTIQTGASKAKKTEQVGADKLGDENYQQFGEEHFSKLTKTVSGTTPLGAPATTYALTGKGQIGVYGAAPEASFTGAVTSGAIYSALNLTAQETMDVTVYGTTTTPSESTFTVTKNDKTTLTGAGNGVETFVYNFGTASAPDYEIVVLKGALGSISSVTNTKETSTHGAYTTYGITEEGSSTPINKRDYTTVVDANEDNDQIVLNGTFAKGDKVTFYMGTDGVTYVYPVTTMTGVLTSVSGKNVLTVDGSTYNLSAVTGAVKPTANTKEQSFYVDHMGNVIKSYTDTTTNYAYVVPGTAKVVYTQAEDNTLTPANQVTVINMEGEVETVITSTDWSSYYGKAVTYTVNKKGAYVYGALAANMQDVGDALKTKNATAIGNLKTNNKTLYVVLNSVRDDDADDGSRKFAGTVTTYTGYTNAPVFASVINSVAVDTDTTPDGIANVVFIGDFVVAATETGSYIYVTGDKEATVNGVEYAVIKAGEASTVIKSTDSLTAKTLYSAIGATDTAAVRDALKIENKGGLVWLDGAYANKTVADDVKVYTIDMNDDSVTVTTAGELDGAFDANFNNRGSSDLGTRGVYIEMASGSAVKVATIYILYNSAD